MVTSKFIRSSLPLGNDILHVFGRFNSLISTESTKTKWMLILSTKFRIWSEWQAESTSQLGLKHIAGGIKRVVYQ